MGAPHQISVTGATRLVPVIGHPIVQARSPALFSALAAQKGRDALFVPMDIPPSGFAAALNGLRNIQNISGFIITVPHKPLALEFVDHISDVARLVGAANVIRVEPDGRWSADILDGAGLLRGLSAAKVSVVGKSVQIVGAGGAGSAVAHALAAAGAAHIFIADTEAAKSNALVTRLAQAFDRTVFAPGLHVSSVDIVVNASPVGMNGVGGTPFDPALLHRGQVLAEMIMSPAETPLLAAARATGCTTVAGLETLNGQADAVMAFFGF